MDITITLTEEELYRLKYVFHNRQRDSIAGTDIDVRISDKLLSAHPKMSIESEPAGPQLPIIPVYLDRNSLWYFVDYFRLLGDSPRRDVTDISPTRDIFNQLRDAWLSGGEEPPSGSEPTHPPRTLKSALRAKDVEMDRLGQTASNLLRQVTNLKNEKEVLINRAEKAEKELEQTLVQLAGCLTAAEGSLDRVKKGDYGWSLAYQTTCDLFDKMMEYKKGTHAICQFVHEELGGTDGETLNIETCIVYLRSAFTRADVPAMESKIRVLERDVETAEREAIRIGMDYNKLSAEITRLFDPAKMTPSRVAYDMLIQAEATVAASFVVREKCKNMSIDDAATTLSLLGESLQAHAVLLDSCLGKNCLPNPLPTLKSELKKALDLHRNTFQKENA